MVTAQSSWSDSGRTRQLVIRPQLCISVSFALTLPLSVCGADDRTSIKDGAITLLRCYYHFVPFPPQRSAATQPQAMLAPLLVKLETLV